MDEILHHFETMGNHCLLVFTRESDHSRVSERWCLRGFRNHPHDRVSHPVADLLHVVGVLRAGLHELDPKAIRQLLSEPVDLPQTRGFSSFGRGPGTTSPQNNGAPPTKCGRWCFHESPPLEKRARYPVFPGLVWLACGKVSVCLSGTSPLRD